MKDIVIDANFISVISGSPTLPIAKLVEWLKSDGFLAVSNQLWMEYQRAVSGIRPDKLWAAIINKLMRDGRLVRYEKKQLEGVVIKKKDSQKFISNFKDHHHVRLLILSTRKLLLTLDDNLHRDVNVYRPVQLKAIKCPSEVDLSAF